MRLTAGCMLVIVTCAALFPGGRPAFAKTALRQDQGVFDPAGAPFDPARYRMRETLKLSGPRIGSPSVSFGELERARGAAASRVGPARGVDKKRIALAVLASAILPGAGEMYVWSDTRRRAHLVRSATFLLYDAFFFYGYKHHHSRGKDIKARYEAFCDAHWSEERFLQLHPGCDIEGGCSDWREYNEIARNNYYFFVYVPKELDREEYYENCGKYDAFAFGWDDWDGDYENFQPWTPNRLKYWDMRFASDRYLLRGDQFVMMMLVNRVVSMLDAGWLAYRASNGAYDTGGWSLDLRPGLVAPTVGVSYRF